MFGELGDHVADTAFDLDPIQAGRLVSVGVAQRVEDGGVLVGDGVAGLAVVHELGRGRRALEISLSDETLRELDDIWPGPGGEAPQAYAW
ncbi:hypothetical protein [Nonomuraea aurantiaca]|uniref:hypothetical protein n=1 Tax=Nonomuraea aurantiaca TaxID=2878562 RepID=UPI001CD9C14A|nr:hypothetical protein [Nonomuraea aurantiaca]MCA2226452.1 hypothetical protein [Nonomuraea aurantiaca]